MRARRLFEGLLPAAVRLRRGRMRIENAFAREIAAARRDRKWDEAHRLEADRAMELQLHDEEDDEYLTKSLVAEAQRLRVAVPRVFNDDGSESIYWHTGNYTGGRYLTRQGISSLREELRRERKALHEERARWIFWVSSLTGLVGALTGLVAVFTR